MSQLPGVVFRTSMLCHQARNAHPVIHSVICRSFPLKARPSGNDLNPTFSFASQSSVKSKGLNGVLTYGGLPGYS